MRHRNPGKQRAAGELPGPRVVGADQGGKGQQVLGPDKPRCTAGTSQLFGDLTADRRRLATSAETGRGSDTQQPGPGKGGQVTTRHQLLVYLFGLRPEQFISQLSSRGEQGKTCGR